MSVALLIPFLRSYGFTFIDNITADFTNYNLRTRALAAGWDGAAPLIATVNLSSGKVISAHSTGVYAFDTGTTAYPAGSSLALTMASAYICGMGGEGGAYSQGGLPGGPALRVTASIPATVDAAGGVIAGGGGGGGGGYSGSHVSGGGGGRSGRISSAGGAKLGGSGVVGSPGTFTAGGKGGDNGAGSSGYPGGVGGTTGPGGPPTPNYVPNGGGGGGWGASGGHGGQYNGNSRPGGAGGAAVVGNAYITWTNTGTRYGSIS